jgi:hypothetical protein
VSTLWEGEIVTSFSATECLLWAARRLFPKCWFDEKKTEAGRDALGYYHERELGQRKTVKVGFMPGANPCSDLLAHLRSDLVFRPRLVWICSGAVQNDLKSFR